MSFTQVTGRIDRIERLKNSTNGNPRFQIGYITEGKRYQANTAADASIGYEVGNLGKREGDNVTLTFNSGGRIIDIESADKPSRHGFRF